jgi:hypothetical protein
MHAHPFQVPFLKVYTVCVNNQDVGQDLIYNLNEANPKFRSLLDVCSREHAVPQVLISIGDRTLVCLNNQPTYYIVVELWRRASQRNHWYQRFALSSISTRHSIQDALRTHSRFDTQHARRPRGPGSCPGQDLRHGRSRQRIQARGMHQTTTIAGYSTHLHACGLSSNHKALPTLNAKQSEISHSLIILDQSLIGNRESLESELKSNVKLHTWKKHVSVRPLLQSCARAACGSLVLCSYRECKGTTHR